MSGKSVTLSQHPLYPREYQHRLEELYLPRAEDMSQAVSEHDRAGRATVKLAAIMLAVPGTNPRLVRTDATTREAEFASRSAFSAPLYR